MSIEKNHQQLSSSPEWDLRHKTIDSRFTTCKLMQIKNEGKENCTSMEVMFWPGIVNLAEEDPRFYFLNSKNELDSDQVVRRSKMQEPLSRDLVKYDFDQILPILSSVRNKQYQWIHFLMEEIIWCKGRQLIKIIKPPKLEVFWYLSNSPILNNDGKTMMSKIFKSSTTKEDRIVMLSNPDYLDSTLGAILDLDSEAA